MLGWLRKGLRLEQMNTGIVAAFTRIKEDLHSQKKFLEDFYEQHHGFKNTTSLNHQRMAEWIKHFDSSIKRIEKDMVVLQRGVRAELNSMSKASVNLHKEAYARNIKELHAAKKEILREVEVFMKENHEKHVKTLPKPLVNVDNVTNVKNIMHETSFDNLSNPEKWLVGVLFNTQDPLSYSQISKKTGKSINTVRVYMNQLKFKGFVDESTLPNGVKLFALRHKAKVKKLYNL